MLKIRPAFRCSEIIKQKFNTSKCLLTISVGQETHEKERFASTLDLIGRSFSSCIIALHDSLQRHTIALNEEHEAEYFHTLAVSIGDAWLKKNEQYINALRIPVKIRRWDQWIDDPDFLKSKEKVLRELEQCAKYRAAFSHTIEDYLSRYSRRLKRPDLFNIGRAQKLCMDYLIEECAVLCLWSKTECQFEAYTGKHNAAMIETQKRFLSAEILQSVAVVFNHRPNLKPQNFGFEESVENLISIFPME